MNKTGAEHLAGARQNLAFAQVLAGQGRCSWATTVLFYSAVHWARAYLASRHGLKVVRHDDMKKLWPTMPDLAKIRSSYDLLKEKSHAHRYFLVQFTKPQFDGLLVHLQKIQVALEPLILEGSLSTPAGQLAVPNLPASPTATR